MACIKEGIIELAKNKEVSVEDFAESIGMTYSSFKGSAKYTPLNSDAIGNVLTLYKDVNAEWLMTGNGDMLKDDSLTQYDKSQFSISQFRQKGYAPYYSNLPLSARGMGLTNIEQNDKPESWIKFPNVDADGWFPIIGCSMEPKIFAGDIVGVKQIDNWERIDPDKTYMIITRDDRMIKHLETDENDNNVLWAVSENYRRFKISKDEIIRIFRVVWAGRFV